MVTKRICVYGGAAGYPAIWEALRLLLPASLDLIDEVAQAEGADAIIILEGGETEIAEAARLVPRCFVALRDSQAVTSKGGAISFSQDFDDPRLRGRTLAHEDVSVTSLCPIASGADVIARYGTTPIWLQQEIGRSMVDIVTITLPELRATELPFEYLRARNFIRLLPLVHFIRKIIGKSGWEAPPLRACFMFDDPNLHRSSYGYVTFNELLLRARSAPFHVSFAMVPFDVWYADERTARLFREHPGHLSLLFHGNDHLRRELALFPEPNDQVRMLAQARRRIEGFERRTRLSVAKVMAPPHGALHRETPAALLRLGFHGAFISPWSLRDWGIERTATAAFGLDLAEVTAPGLPIAPRFRLSADCEGEAVIAAFLNQPIVPVGHHDSLAGDPDLLTEVAEMINSLGTVTWTDPQAILETNCASLISNDCLRLRPASVSFDFKIPDTVTSVVLEPSATALSSPEYIATNQETGRTLSANARELRVQKGERLHFEAAGFGATNYHGVSRPRFSAWAPARRLLCEARDRALPMAKRLSAIASRPRSGVGNSMKLQPFSR